MKYETKAAKASETIDLKLEIDSMNEKVKLTIFEDGTDEQFLKLIKEFRNMIKSVERHLEPPPCLDSPAIAK
jgi:hypothetical protein